MPSSLQATTSSGISHFRKPHLKQHEVVMNVLSTPFSTKMVHQDGNLSTVNSK